jgi:hypothetical protein
MKCFSYAYYDDQASPIVPLYWNIQTKYCRCFWPLTSNPHIDQMCSTWDTSLYWFWPFGEGWGIPTPRESKPSELSKDYVVRLLKSTPTWWHLCNNSIPSAKPVAYAILHSCSRYLALIRACGCGADEWWVRRWTEAWCVASVEDAKLGGVRQRSMSLGRWGHWLMRGVEGLGTRPLD